MDFDVEKFKRIHSHNGEITLTNEQIEFYYQLAVRLLGKKEKSIIEDDEERELAYQLMVCHIITINGRNGMIGTITNASEGSVSVGTQIPQSLTQSYLSTTPCGLWLWELLTKYRKGIRWYPYRRW